MYTISCVSEVTQDDLGDRKISINFDLNSYRSTFVISSTYYTDSPR